MQTSIQKGNLVSLKNFNDLYLLIVDEIRPGFFKCSVFSEDVEKGTLSPNTPFLIVEKEKTILVCLPIWVYASETILKQIAFSIQSTKLSETVLKEFFDYCHSTPIPETPQGKYIKTIAKSLANINTASILEFLQSVEEEEG